MHGTKQAPWRRAAPPRLGIGFTTSGGIATIRKSDHLDRWGSLVAKRLQEARVDGALDEPVVAIGRQLTERELENAPVV